IEDERPRTVEPDLLTELLARSRGLPAEPLVVTLRPGDDDPIGRYLVKLDRLLLLRVVPDRDEIRDGAQQRLARQMVPAADAEHRAKTERAGAEIVIELGRTQIDERRDQHHVGLLLAVEVLELAAAGHGLLELPQNPRQRAESAGRAQHRQRRQPSNGLRGPLLRPPSKPGRVVVARIEKTKIVDAEPQLSSEV